MEAGRGALIFSFALSVSFLLLASSASAQLRTDFYKNTCPNVESLVRSAVTQKFQQTFITAQATVRLFFHDCFVRGCDASVIIASPNNNAEKDHPDDLSLPGDGFDTVIRAKAAVDSDPNCRNKVSCADILALATRDAIVITGGPSYAVELGRRDGRISSKASVQHSLPQPFFNLDQLNTIFSKHGLSQTDMIALSGAHTLGVSHCSKFSKRIYGFNSTHRIDPTLNFQYAMQLRQMCPLNVDPRVAIPMDASTFHIFDNAYFKNLQQGKGLFISDQVLYTDPRSRPTVDLFAASETAFRDAFVSAITRLGRVGVLTGSMGEIRIDCSRPN
ncbi:hypothetical protein SAY86_007263 [Trapa natans]|uniref:Peroxidase n=1 Tax=Trapa natans TaxID=22666 RepID=A0AAN7LE87_TRANT|nr:hypothetical protein SAY86_007263 [Trapa natans]